MKQVLNILGILLPPPPTAPVGAPGVQAKLEDSMVKTEVMHMESWKSQCHCKEEEGLVTKVLKTQGSGCSSVGRVLP